MDPGFFAINAGFCSITYAAFTIEVMQIDDKGRPRPRGQLETLEADDLILALGQDTDTAFLRKIPGVEFKDDGTVIVTQMMTDYPGLFAGGDMVPSEVHRYHLRRARQEGGAQHRRLPSGPELHQAAQAAEEGPGHRSTSCTTILASSSGRSRTPTFSAAAPGGAGRVQRRREQCTAFVLRQLLRVLRGLPRGRDRQARAEQALPVHLRTVHGLRDLVRAVSVPFVSMIPEPSPVA